MSVDSINAGKRFIHYDPDRTDYSVTPEELRSFQDAGANIWKDACLVLGALGVPCFINALAATPSPFQLSASLFLNYFFGVIGLVLSVIFGIAWWKSAQTVRALVDRIKSKPRHELAPGSTDVGALASQNVGTPSVSNVPR